MLEFSANLNKYGAIQLDLYGPGPIVASRFDLPDIWAITLH